MRAKSILVAASGVAMGLVIAGPALARMMSPSRMPVQRLESNLKAYLQEHPQDAEGHYVLGRVYAYAFTADTTSLAVWQNLHGPLPLIREPGSPPGLGQRITTYDSKSLEKQGTQPYTVVPLAETSLTYLTEGIRELRKAIELDGSRSTYHLTLGYLLDQSRHLASYVDAGELLGPRGAGLDPKLVSEITLAVHDLAEDDKAEASLRLLNQRLEEGITVLSRLRIRPDPRSQHSVQALLERYWAQRCIDEYKRAFDLGLEADLSLASHREHAGLESFEAGTALLRLRAELPDPFPLDTEALAAINARLGKIDAIEAHTFVSPIILPAAPGQGIDELSDPSTRVCFDLDGDGVAENCSWVRPTTGILVWDPDRSGRVESGRDMFGNATWWLLFSDGYRALDALDDDRDGWLTGAELDHLSVWYDLNSDGRAEPGEVIPIERTEIVGLATHWDAHEGTALRATRGMLLRGGRVLPSYDWYADCVR